VIVQFVFFTDDAYLADPSDVSMPCSLVEASSDLMLIFANWSGVTFSTNKSIHTSNRELGETSDEKAYRTLKPLLFDGSNNTCNLGFRSKLRVVKETLAHEACIEF
jgi:hypothetical protein